jgi:hypothetical protein
MTNFELVEDGKTYREWCLPATLINSKATLRVVATHVLVKAAGRCISPPGPFFCPWSRFGLRLVGRDLAV